MRRRRVVARYRRLTTSGNTLRANDVVLCLASRRLNVLFASIKAGHPLRAEDGDWCLIMNVMGLLDVASPLELFTLVEGAGR